MIVGLDHVTVGVPELEAGIEDWAARSGVRPAPGGPHPGLGTRNALASLGPDLYLELIAVDPDQTATSPARSWLAELDRPRPFGWCFACDDAERTLQALASAGVEARRVPLRRELPAGGVLEWELLLPVHELGPVVPYLIDWGEVPSPGAEAPKGCVLEEVVPQHPDPAAAQSLLDRMGIDARVVAGPRSGPALGFGSAKGSFRIEP